MAVSVAEAQQLLVEQAEYVLESELVHLVDPISVHVDAQHVSVGVAGIDKTGSGQVVRVAEINGVAYPVEIE